MEDETAVDLALLAQGTTNVSVRQSCRATSIFRKLLDKDPEAVRLWVEDGRLVWKGRKAGGSYPLEAIKRVVKKTEDIALKIWCSGEKTKFFFDDRAELDRWVTALKSLVHTARTDTFGSYQITASWLACNPDGKDELGEKELAIVIPWLEPDPRTNAPWRPSALIQKYSTTRAHLSRAEFEKMYMELHRDDPVVKELMEEYSQEGGILDASDIAAFLFEEQGVERALAAEETLRILEEFSSDKTSLNSNQFLAYLSSIQNEAMDVSQGPRDTDQPLHHYFIASSHNTYLLGNQFSSKSSVDAYAYALGLGSRCVELDVHDGDNGRPTITHGATVVSEIPLEEVAEWLRDHAFDSTDFPLIVSIENHCSADQQILMASMLQSTFGSLLLLPHGSSAVWPTLESLRRRILIKCSIKEKLVDEMRNITVIRGYKHADWPETLKLPPWSIHSFSESKLEEILEDRDDDKLQSWNDIGMSRIYPKGTRLLSTNLIPEEAWQRGCQMVAMNYQTVDYGMVKNWGMFRQNMGCGYLLRPVEKANKLKVSVRILGGHDLPTEEGKTSSTPYVSVFASSDDSDFPRVNCTGVAKNGNLKPVFMACDDQPFVLEVDNDVTGSVMMAVWHREMGRDDLLCVAAVPVLSLRPGFRSVHSMLDTAGHILPDHTYLMCHFQLEDF